MTVRSGRIVRAAPLVRPSFAYGPTEPVLSTAPGTGAYVFPAEALALVEQARDLKEQAQQQAAQMIEQAMAEKEQMFQQSLIEAKEKAAVDLAASRLLVERQIARADEQQLQRSIDVAKLLAERVVRQYLDQQPETLLALARLALDKFRRAQHTRLYVHPSHVQRLDNLLPSLDFAPGAISVHPAEELPIGDLRIISDLGDLTFSINGQLDRLVAALRQPDDG